MSFFGNAWDFGIRIDQFRRQIISRLQISTEELLKLQKAEAGAVEGKNIRIVDDVHTPPDVMEPIVGNGEGTGPLTEFSERLTAFRYLLYSLGVDPDDSKQVQMEIGRVKESMMRRVSYVSVLIKSLGRLVELCNQVGNRSFVWKTGDPQDIARYAAMGKEEKKRVLAEYSDQGTDIVMSKGWMERMRAYLEGQEIAGGAAVKPRFPRILEDLRDAESAADAVREILETEGVLKIEERIEGDRKENVLAWKKIINPQKKYGGHSSLLCTLLGRVQGISGIRVFQSFPSILPTIRDLYAGRFDREEGGNPDMKFEFADQAGREEMLRALLEAQGVLKIEKREEGGSSERVLVWLKTINPDEKYGGHSLRLNILLGRVRGVSGKVAFQSFSSILQSIRELYAGRFDREEGGNPDMKFEFADQAGREEMLRALLEAQGVLKIEKREEGGSPERVLVWLKTMNTNKKYGGYFSPLCSLLGRIQGVSGAEAFQSFSSILPTIRDLYAGRFDREEGGNPDMKFELADKTGREEILRSLLENEGLVQIKDRVLVLYKLINTQKKYGGHSSPLCSLLGRIQGLNGAVIFKSFSSILQPIRDLYAGRFDWEEGGNLDMKFEFADQDGRQEILRALLEAQGVLKIEKRDEKGSPVRVLVWLKTINPNKGYGGHSSFLCTLLGRIQGVSGAKPFQSFPSILQPIRDLYAGKFDHEEWLIPKPTEE